jgi:hypothetical protein
MNTFLLKGLSLSFMKRLVQLPAQRRRRQSGANLAILCLLGTLIFGFVGICLYSGMQTYVEGDLQKTAMNAAMSGAAAYYGTIGPNGAPTANSDLAKNVASNTFNSIVNQGSLKGFGVTLKPVTNNDSNDSVTVTAQAVIPLPFLSLIGVNQMQINSSATAFALRYEPTLFTGPISILPVAGNIASYSQVIQLAFPLVDGPGIDLYVEQNPALQQPYIVEACNSSSCYNLVSGATPVGSSKIITLPDGTMAIAGTAAIDLVRAGVRKGSALRFTHANIYDSWTNGVPNPPPSTPTPLVISRVMLFGYAGACSSSQSCSIPTGFAPVR